MDFARRQLEKYGWTSGKGLGKHENGIAEALKPKIKRSVTGIGHDPAAEFNEHWWSALYDKAAKNVKVKEKNGKTKKIKTVDSNNFTITNSTWKINRKHKSKENNEYSDYFIKKATLQNGQSRVENVAQNKSEDEEKDKKQVFKMTDEELFAACEGRTAHKGARHGLRALGKLARIAEQEQILLSQSKYEGYSLAKKINNQKIEEIVEDMSLEDIKDTESKNEKKKKRKRCVNENNILAESESLPASNRKPQKLKSKHSDLSNNTSNVNNTNCGRKTKIDKEILEDTETDYDDNINKAKKNNKRKSYEEHIESDNSKKKKKKK